MLTASSYLPSLMSLRELRRAGDVGPLADHDEDARLLRERLRAGKAQRLELDCAAAARQLIRLDFAAARARRLPFERLRDRRDVLRRVAAASAGDVDQARLRELAEDSAPCPAAPDRSRSARADWAARRSDSTRSRRRPSPTAPRGTDTSGPGPSEQLSPTESGFTCSTAFQNASIVCAEIMRLAAASDRRRDHDRQLLAVLVEHLADRDQRSLGVQRIEDRFDQQQIRRRRRSARAPAACTRSSPGRR